MRQAVLLTMAVALIAGAGLPAMATVQSDRLCVASSIEFPVPCDENARSDCLLADGARPVRPAIGEVHMKVIMMQPIVVRSQDGRELRTCTVMHCSQEDSRPPVTAPALLY